MSEVSYAELDKFDEDIVRLKTNLVLRRFINGQISLKEAISNIYLENIERPPKKRKYEIR